MHADNRINTCLQSKRSPKSPKLLNWALALSEFDYEVQHIRSKNNGISDCLSRIHSINVLFELKPETSLNDLKTAQSQDPHLHAAINYLAANRRYFDVKLLGPLARQRKKLYVSSDGILYWKQCVVIQQQLRSSVLQLCHNHLSSGHFGIDRTWARFSNTYYWPNAKDDVTNWIKSCETSNAFNPPTGGYHKAPLQPIESSNCFELVCYDLAGPFMPTTPHGNTHTLILVDHFTKWPEVISLPDTNASTTARAIYDQWICRFGVIKQLHSDGAPNVHGYLMQDVCSL